MSFNKTDLPAPKRVCLRLKETREAKKLTLEELAVRTRINKKYLVALEACRFELLPAGLIYQKQFIKRYAEALDVPSDAFLEQFLAEEIPEVPDKDTALPPATSSRQLSNLPHLLRVLFVGGTVGALLVYLATQVQQSITPPVLTVVNPQDGFIAASPTLMVEGSTERETQITINGQEVGTSNEGTFQETMSLSPGTNTIVISAKKKHGKTTTETRHVVLKSL